MVGLSAARIHGPPGPVELPGVDAPFVPARISADRPHNGSYYDKRWMSLAELTCPYATTLSDSQRERGRQADCLPPILRPYPRSNGSEGNGIGNAKVSRRALLGGALIQLSRCESGLAGRTPAAASQQRHIPWRASSARHVLSAWSWITCWTWLKLALGWSIAHGFGVIDMDGQDGQD